MVRLLLSVAALLIALVVAGAGEPATALRASGPWLYTAIRWSPDGKQVGVPYYTSVYSDAGWSIETLRLWVARADRFAERLVAERQLQHPGDEYFYFAWSPDSRHLAIHDRKEISIAPVDRPRRTKVARAREYEYVEFGDWAPDGKRIVFTRRWRLWEEPVLPTVHFVARDGKGERRLGIGETPDWSPRGTRIALAGGAYGRCGNRRIYTISPGGGGLRQLTTDGTTDPRGRPADRGDQLRPRWSPDGTMLIYGEGPPCGWIGDGASYSVADDGRRETHLLGAAGAVWSPRGDRIALFRSWDSGPTTTVAPDGSSPVEVVGVGFFTWGPDGRRIAFSDGKSVFVARPDGSGRRRLAAGRNPVWAPRGSKIAFLREGVPCGERLYVVDAAGGNARPLVSCTIVGSADDDTLRGTLGRDRILGFGGMDSIYSRDRVRDQIWCGRDRDSVWADRLDRVARDCEVVRRRA